MRKITILAVLTSAIIMGGCTNNPYTGESQMSKGAKYGGIGALGGAAVGALAGGKKGALIGLAAGGIAGGGYGYYADTQEKKLREQLTGTGVQMVREGDNIYLTMPGNITFESANANMSSTFYPTLNSIATVLKEYPDSAIKVIGHTDNTGSFEKNQVLSEQRASSVANYLIAQGISNQRVQVIGQGPRSPIADNNSEAGKQANRRVEIQIINPKQG